jgi:hypothetical protein
VQHPLDEHGEPMGKLRRKAQTKLHPSVNIVHTLPLKPMQHPLGGVHHEVPVVGRNVQPSHEGMRNQIPDREV